MFQDSPLFSLLSLGIAGYLFYMWYGDFLYFKKNGEPRKGVLEGAKPAPVKLVVIGVVLSLILLASHTCIEISLGISGEQTKVQYWAILSWCGAAFVEELIFRGYLVVKNRGNFLLVVSILFFSVLFAAGHPFVWDYTVPEGGSILSGAWTFNFTLQPIFSTLAIFECSLLFYALRFVPMNKELSIIPCIAAHLAYNVGVFAIKLFQGFVG